MSPIDRPALSLRELLDADWRRLAEVSGGIHRPRRWRDAFSPRFACIVLIRIAQRLYATGWPRLARATSLINFLLFGIEVPPRLVIGPGLVIPHSQGTILGAGYIGENVTIFHQVTLGARTVDFAFDPALRPYVCDGVTITAGAKVLGPVRLGERCLIGANAVVLEDVAADSLAVGVPARIIPRNAATEGGES
jgi:serine O-acetyltransferase